VDNVIVEWSGTEAREGHNSVDVLTLAGTLEGSEVVEAVVTYDVALANDRVTWAAPVEEQDLNPEDEIESAAPLLVSRTAEIWSEEETETVHRIYAFTAQHLSWPERSRVGGVQSALAAYQTGVGVCGEFANLMTALCRAAGIPARSIRGLSFPTFIPPYITKRSAWMHPAGSHAWVEVEVGDNWALADPSLVSNLPFDRFWFGRPFGRYLSYGARDEHDRIYKGMMRWAEERGEIVGAMSAPVKFAAAADGEGISVVPEVSVQKRRDPRWWGAVGAYATILVGFVLIERRLKFGMYG
jgi:hypothetical protein